MKINYALTIQNTELEAMKETVVTIMASMAKIKNEAVPTDNKAYVDEFFTRTSNSELGETVVVDIKNDNGTVRITSVVTEEGVQLIYDIYITEQTVNIILNAYTAIAEWVGSFPIKTLQTLKL